MIIANLATYPKRVEILDEAIGSIANQVEQLNVVLNEYKEVPGFISKYKNVNAIIPEKDYKDVGKFLPDINEKDYVLTVDDDIIYPHDYVSRLLTHYDTLGIESCVLGLHGTIYSDFFDGRPSSRFVYSFKDELLKPLQVNQLGTGTVFMPGKVYPSVDYMEDAQGFVDIRFAKYCNENLVPQICITRKSNWLRPVHHDGSTIFDAVTSNLPTKVFKECLEIAGVSKLDPALYGKLNSHFELSLEC